MGACALQNTALAKRQFSVFAFSWKRLVALACRIASWYPNVVLEDEGRWEEYMKWLTQRLVRMDQVLRPIVKALP